MELNDYQQKAMTTCLPTSNNFSYMMLNLVGEVGEFASKIAKRIRKDEMEIGYPNDGSFDVSEEEEDIEYFPNDIKYVTAVEASRHKARHEELEKEAGDILWQLAGLCSVMGWTLEEVAQMNLDKLASRQERGKIDGNGDNR